LKLVGYFTEFAHSCYHTAFDLNFVLEERMIKSHYDKKTKVFSLRVEDVEEQIKKDIEDGFIPFFFGFVVGGTGLGLADPIAEILKITQKYGLYTVVDAAWAGIARFCPEHRNPSCKVLEGANSFLVNFDKWGMGGHPGAVMFIDDRHSFVEAMGGNAPRP
jgi:glutamate/tyrosine decarboxylase-like PLP-dependent enzyme